MLTYFAYGSNLSGPRLRARLGPVEFVEIGRLRGHQLRFHKRSVDGSAKADALATGISTHVVPGVIWAIPRKAQSALDHFEGRGQGYETDLVRVETATGRRIEALTYRATDLDPSLKPYGWYLAHLILGAREHGLASTFEQALTQIPWKADPDAARQEREMSIYPPSARDPCALLRCNPDNDLAS